MLIGNHSAGKSSFINWYIEEHIQRTGVAIETQGIRRSSDDLTSTIQVSQLLQLVENEKP